MVILNKNILYKSNYIIVSIISDGNVGCPGQMFHCHEIQTILIGKNIFKLVLKLCNSHKSNTFTDYTIEIAFLYPIINAFLVKMYLYYNKTAKYWRYEIVCVFSFEN